MEVDVVMNFRNLKFFPLIVYKSLHLIHKCFSKYYCYHYYIMVISWYYWIGSSWNSWIPQCGKIISDQPFVKEKNVPSSSKTRSYKRLEVIYSFYFLKYLRKHNISNCNDFISSLFYLFPDANVGTVESWTVLGLFLVLNMPIMLSWTPLPHTQLKHQKIWTDFKS